MTLHEFRQNCGAGTAGWGLRLFSGPDQQQQCDSTARPDRGVDIGLFAITKSDFFDARLALAPERYRLGPRMAFPAKIEIS